MQSFSENLIFSLNATIPIFLMMIFGWFIEKTNLLDEHSTQRISQFAFRALLPALLFMDLSTSDFKAVWDGKFVLFCLIVTICSITIAFFLSLPLKDWSDRGEFIQASYRSSAAVLGIAFVNNIYGNSTMAALMIIGTIPLYNIVAVIVLSLTAPKKDGNINAKTLFQRTAKDVFTNPIILGIIVGLLWSILRIPQPVILSKSIGYLGNMAAPLSLIALGASFRISDAKEKTKPTMSICGIKLVLFCIIFLPLAIALGFRDEKLIAILVMLGSATTGSCFVMARNMGHKGTITSCAVMLTTLLSAVSLTTWLFLLKTWAYI